MRADVFLPYLSLLYSLSNDNANASVDGDLACIDNVLRWSPFEDDGERHVYEELCYVTFGKEVIDYNIDPRS